MLPERVRILYIIDYWASPGGTERHLSYLLSSLDSARFQCAVVVFNYQPNALADAAKSKGIEVIHLPVARYYTPHALWQACKLFAFIRRRRFDVVQTFHYKADIYGATIARLAGVQYIVSSKRDAADYKSSFRFFLHRLVRPITRRYIAVSAVVAKVIQEKEKVPNDKISIIYNGVNLDAYAVPDEATKAHAKAALGLNADDFVVGMSAWFRPEKDHQLLLDAYMEIARQAPAAKLVLVGGGPLLEHYRQWVADKQLGDCIKLVGPVGNVDAFLKAFDVACLVPKINEGFSNSVLEKMSTGLPVIVTDIGGNKEAVAHGENGFVIAAGDLKQLVQHLLTLYRDLDLRRRMGHASRQRVEKLFSLGEMVNRHERLYLSMMSADGGTQA